mgnify:FL=1
MPVVPISVASRAGDCGKIQILVQLPGSAQSVGIAAGNVELFASDSMPVDIDVRFAAHELKGFLQFLSIDESVLGARDISNCSAPTARRTPGHRPGS